MASTAGGKAKARPSGDSASVTTDANGLCVSLTPTRDWPTGIAMTVGMVGWTAVEIFVFVALTKEHLDAGGLFVGAWLMAWTVLGYFGGARWLFMFWGREQLLVGPRSLILRRTVLGQNQDEEFDIALVDKVRTIRGGTIEFSSKEKAYRFGPKLSAAMLVTIEEAIEQSRHRSHEPPS